MLHRTIQGNEGNTSTETDMAKGRPKQEERLRAVEELLMANNSVNRQDTARIAALEARMAQIEKRLESADRPALTIDHTRDMVRKVVQNYTPLFDRWPGNGST